MHRIEAREGQPIKIQFLGAPQWRGVGCVYWCFVCCEMCGCGSPLRRHLRPLSLLITLTVIGACSYSVLYHLSSLETALPSSETALLSRNTSLISRHTSLISRNTSLLSRNTSLLSRDTSIYHDYDPHGQVCVLRVIVGTNWRVSKEKRRVSRVKWRVTKEKWRVTREK